MYSDDLKSHDFKKILLIKLSALGDVVHTIPVLNKLRRRYPNARIDWLVTPGIAELLRHNPAINNVIEFLRDEWSEPWRPAPYVSAARLIAQLRSAEYDLVIDLQGQLRSAVFAFTSGAPVRIGFDKPRSDAFTSLSRIIPEEARKHAWKGAREGSWLAYTDTIPLPTLDIHPVERYLGIGPMLGLDDGPADFSFPIPHEATGAHRRPARLLRDRQSKNRDRRARHSLGNQAMACGCFCRGCTELAASRSLRWC